MKEVKGGAKKKEREPEDKLLKIAYRPEASLYAFVVVKCI